MRLDVDWFLWNIVVRQSKSLLNEAPRQIDGHRLCNVCEVEKSLDNVVGCCCQSDKESLLLLCELDLQHRQLDCLLNQKHV